MIAWLTVLSIVVSGLVVSQWLLWSQCLRCSKQPNTRIAARGYSDDEGVTTTEIPRSMFGDLK